MSSMRMFVERGDWLKTFDAGFTRGLCGGSSFGSSFRGLGGPSSVCAAATSAARVGKSESQRSESPRNLSTMMNVRNERFELGTRRTSLSC